MTLSQRRDRVRGGSRGMPLASGLCRAESGRSFSVGTTVWTRLSTPGRWAGQGGATGSSRSTFSKTARAPCPHKPEMPQKVQHSAVWTSHFRWTLKRTQNPCRQLVPANAGTSTAEGPRVPGRVPQTAATSQPSQPCLTSELVSNKVTATRWEMGKH